MEPKAEDRLYEERAKALHEGQKRRTRDIFECNFEVLIGQGLQQFLIQFLESELKRLEDYEFKERFGQMNPAETFPKLGKIAKKRLNDVKSVTFTKLADSELDPELFALQIGFTNWVIDTESNIVLEDAHGLEAKKYPLDAEQIYEEEWYKTTKPHFIENLLPEIGIAENEGYLTRQFNNIQIKRSAELLFVSLPERTHIEPSSLIFYTAFKDSQFQPFSNMQNEVVAEVGKKMFPGLNT